MAECVLTKGGNRLTWGMKLAKKIPESVIRLVFNHKFSIREKKRYNYSRCIPSNVRELRNPVILNKLAKWRVKGEQEKAHRMPLELIGTIKRYPSGLYQFERFKSSLNEVKEYARGKGVTKLKMGAVTFTL